MQIGIIEDNEWILKENLNRNFYNGARNIIYLMNDLGNIYFPGQWGKLYCNTFHKKDTIITITLDMDKRTLRFKIDDRDCGDADGEISYEKYRLAVNLYHRGYTLELL